MHYNNKIIRDEIIRKNPHLLDTKHKVLCFINLCIYPIRFEQVYFHIRSTNLIATSNYDALKGAIVGLLILAKRKGRFAQTIAEEAALDFIDFIRMDKKPDAEKFLLNFRNYLPRYLFAKGLQIAFNVDWREVVFDGLELRKMPKHSTYHGMFSNKYLRDLLQCYIVYKKFRDVHDDDYKVGENDLPTLLAQYQQKSSLSEGQFQALFNTLMKSLPSWNLSTRKKAAMAIDNFLDGYYIINVPLNSYLEAKANQQNGEENEQDDCVE
jgi:hypothetical protein